MYRAAVGLRDLSLYDKLRLLREIPNLLEEQKLNLVFTKRKFKIILRLSELCDIFTRGITV